MIPSPSRFRVRTHVDRIPWVLPGCLGIAGFLAALTPHSLVAQTAPLPQDVETAMRRANDYYQSTNAQGAGDWLYGAYHTGNFRAGQVLQEPAYTQYSRTWGTLNNWQVGQPWPVAGGSNTPRLHADSHVAGQTYFDLSQLDSTPAARTPIQQAMTDLLANVSWNDGRADTIDNNADDDWWWIDAFYMAGPVLARVANLENNEAYRSQLGAMYRWMKTTRGLFDPAAGLWYRDAAAKTATSQNGGKVFWSRGNGWVLGGLVRVLEQLPASHPDRAEYEAMFQTLCAALLPLQGTDGFWRASLTDPAHYPNPETSGTAFFAYAYGWGIRNGLLNAATYQPAMWKAWQGLAGTALQENGLLGYVQNVGSGPAAATVSSTRNYGVGAFLLAGSEVLLSLGGLAPVLADAGPPQTLVAAANAHEAAFTLNAAGSVLRSGSVLRWSWWTGDSFLAEGPQPTVTFPRGSHRVSLRIEHSGGTNYEDTTTISLMNPSGEIPVSAVTASANDGNLPANTLDANFATRWSADGIGQWIEFDLGTARPVSGVSIAFYLGNQRTSTFSVQLSADAAVWTSVLTNRVSSGTTTALELFSFAATTARYVRIVGAGNSQSTWNSLTEVRVQGTEIPPSPDTNNLPDDWEIARFGTNGQDPDADPDGDGMSTGEEFIAGSDPTDSSDIPRLRILSNSPAGITLRFEARSAFGPGTVGRVRWHRLSSSDSLQAGSWVPVPGWEAVRGTGLPVEATLPGPSGRRFYRAESWLSPP